MSGPPVKSSLVDVQWLAGRSGPVVILDASIRRGAGPDGPSGFRDGRADYEQAHLPGARFADLFGELSDPAAPFLFTRPTAGQLQAALARLGIGADSTVVVYDRLTGAWAARVWWVLRSYGFDDVRVLDGGLRAWTDAGHPTESGPGPDGPTASPFVPVDQGGHFVGLDEVKRLSEQPDPSSPVLSALRRAEYLGLDGGPRAGHIPNSGNLPYPDLLDEDGRLSPERTRARIDELGLRDADRVVLYCGGAINAAGLALALTEAGLTRITLYDGSLNEWRSHPELPLAVGDPATGVQPQ